jgi:glycosyltransferase involved in cell wall biosynthesis
MRILVWQWGRRGAGPQLAVDYVDAFASLPGITTFLSLSRAAEIMQGMNAPFCDFPVSTYSDLSGFVGRAVQSPVFVPRIRRHLRALKPDIAFCAMPAALDLAMASALYAEKIPFVVAVHDADPHPGDGFPLQMHLQKSLVQRANGIVALSSHVANRLRAQGLVGDKKLILSRLPPMRLDLPYPMKLPRAHGGKLRLLSFGRLLPYKGLDILAEAMRGFLPRDDCELRIVGSGPETPELQALRGIAGVTVENRWVPQEEIAALLAWSDAVILSHKEASQSGIAVAARSAGRDIVATNVGGLAEQLSGYRRAVLCEPQAQPLREAVQTLLQMTPPSSCVNEDDFSADAAKLCAAFAGVVVKG